MEKFIELKYYKNSKQEIVFENLDEVKESDDVVLKLENDNSNLFFELESLLPRKCNLYIPHIQSKENVLCNLDRLFYIPPLEYKANLITFDNQKLYELQKNREHWITIKNIFPKWKIPEDSAVLFLNMNDFDKYAQDYDTYFTYPNLKSGEDCLDRDYFSIQNHKIISLILPELHAEDKSCPYNKENINKICKELKEKYRVERIELFVSHCFLYFYSIGNRLLKYEIDSGGGSYVDEYIDKITTTNSTSIFKVQKSDRLEVIDCVNFFDI